MAGIKQLKQFQECPYSSAFARSSYVGLVLAYSITQVKHTSISKDRDFAVMLHKAGSVASRSDFQDPTFVMYSVKEGQVGRLYL